MKREYKKPVAKSIDYAYEEQVVAESGNQTGRMGDGLGTGICTFVNGNAASPCAMIVSSDHPGVCDTNAWSMR